MTSHGHESHPLGPPVGHAAAPVPVPSSGDGERGTSAFDEFIEYAVNDVIENGSGEPRHVLGDGWCPICRAHHYPFPRWDEDSYGGMNADELGYVEPCEHDQVLDEHIRTCLQCGKELSVNSYKEGGR